jgi:chemotaxis protein histidine kinase CheA
MGNKQPIELFMPPHMLKAKVGGTGGTDIAAMKRAELAVEELTCEFSGWITDDVKKLMDARTRYSQTPDEASRAALLRAAHDIKGQAPTFHYPPIAHVAATLSRLIDDLPPAIAIPLALVDAHVNAIQMIHKLAMQDANDKTAQALCAELDARVNEVLKAHKK